MDNTALQLALTQLRERVNVLEVQNEELRRDITLLQDKSLIKVTAGQNEMCFHAFKGTTQRVTLLPLQLHFKDDS